MVGLDETFRIDPLTFAIASSDIEDRFETGLEAGVDGGASFSQLREAVSVGSPPEALSH